MQSTDKKHLNIPNCEKCELILNKYSGFHPFLRQWFYTFRSTHLDAHISAAGRGKEDQERFYSLGFSKAHYGQSAHNWNAALDFFRLTQAGGASFDSSWYRAELRPVVMANPLLCWYGAPGSKFLEMPHVEWRSWNQDARTGQLHLVDGPAVYPLPKQS